jgi:hypothetical protein
VLDDDDDDDDVDDDADDADYCFFIMHKHSYYRL